MDGEDGRTAAAYGKVNLGLRVVGRRPDGFHGLVSLAQSVDWHDLVSVARADRDAFTVEGDTRALDTGEGNLVWRAVQAVRAMADAAFPVAAHLTKRIAVAAGLGGGSSDAAAALALASRLFGVGEDRLAGPAAALGADVPFCLHGGLALVEGAGERTTPLPAGPGDYALALVVPPVVLLTEDVYRMWDRLDGPAGPAVTGRHLPPSLRGFAPLANDLFPAAAALAAQVAEWRDELAGRWDRPVAMSGSGPALFGFFPSVDEARDALRAAPAGARAAAAAVPVPLGWEEVH